MVNDGNDYGMGGAHAQQFQVGVYHMPGRVDVHLVQPMNMPWLDFLPLNPHPFGNEYLTISCVMTFRTLHSVEVCY